MRRLYVRPFIVGLAISALAGCGSTVAGTSTTGSSATTAGDGLSVSPPAGSASSAGNAAGSGSSVGGLAGAGGGSGTATGGGTGTAGQAGGSTASGPQSKAQSGALPSARTGKPTLSPVRVGFTTAPDAGKFFAAFGANFSFGDQNAEVKAAVDWVNAHGGLNGHPIDPVIESVSVTSSESYDQQYQQLCSEYTQDKHVVAAAMVGIGDDENMDACMNAAHTLFVTGSNTLHDETDYQRTPYIVSPSEVTASRLAKALTATVLQRHIVTRGGRLGLINFDYGPYNRAIARYVKPMLAAAGVNLTQYTIPPPSSTPDISNSVSVDQSAELKMRSQGIKTVMFLCSGCLIFFAKSAESQHYYPRYIFSSLDGPNGLTDERAYKSAVGIGWEPVNDQNDYTNPKQFSNPTYNLCRKIEKANISSAGALIASEDLCEDAMDMYAAARANPTSTITSASLLQGLLALRGRHPSAFNFNTYLSASQHAGAQQYRSMGWSTKCGCLAYNSTKNVTFPAP